MALKFYRPVIVGAAALLAGCSFSSDSLLPTLTGEDPAGSSSNQQTIQSPPRAAAPQPSRIQPLPQPAPQRSTLAQSSSPSPQPAAQVNGNSSQTFVGGKVVELRRELSRLQANVSKNNTQLQQLRSQTVQEAERYQSAVAVINSRLQVGTTPGNPILIQRFNTSLTLLNKISNDISNMNQLTTRVTADSTLASFLSENTRAAFRLSGAVDQDHQGLAILEDEVNRTVVLVDRLLKELSEDIQRQTSFVATERSNMNTLSAAIKSGESMGASLTNRALTAATQGISNQPVSRPGPAAGQRPLVVIRFDRKNVAYEQALYNAVNQTLTRRPGATFALVAVAPNSGGAARVALNRNKARRNAENVLRSLQRMGLPPARVNLSERTGSATSTEVHLYLN